MAPPRPHKFEEFAPLYVRSRPPGGAWGQEIAIGDSVGSADVAVAPGGWVAIAWRDYDRQETRLTVLQPDGRRASSSSSASRQPRGRRRRA